MSLFTLPMRPTGAPSRPTVRARLRAAGMTIRVTPDGRYRVNFLSGCELDGVLYAGPGRCPENRAGDGCRTEGGDLNDQGCRCCTIGIDAVPPQLAGRHPVFPQLAPELPCLGAQVGDAVVALPDFDPGCPFQECASRAHRVGVRSALDGIAGHDVVGRVELVKAVMAHARERPAAALGSSAVNAV